MLAFLRNKRLSVAIKWSALFAAVVLGLSILGASSLLGKSRHLIVPAECTPDPRGSHCFIASVPYGRWDYQSAPYRSDTRLLENDQELGPAHSIHAEIRTIGRGRFSHWYGDFRFSTSDNSNPLLNGRRYTIVASRTIPTVLAKFSLAWLLLTSVLVLPRRIYGAIRIRVAKAGGPIPWLKGIARITCIFLAASANAIYWLATIPPTWAGGDSVVLMLYGINENCIPHYPPLYPLFTRTVNFAVNKPMLSPGSTIATWGQGNVSDASLYSIIILQQLFLSFVITFFVCSLSKRFLVRLIGVIPFLLTPSLTLFNHGVLSESLWVSFVILAFAAAWRILANDGPSNGNYILYFVALLAGVQTRHVGLIFSFTLPFALLILAIIEREKRAQRTREFAWVISISIAVFLADAAITRLICYQFGVAYRSVYGRSGVYLIDRVNWKQVGDGERLAIEQAVEKKVSSPLVAGAVPVVFAARNPWIGPWQDVHSYLESQHMEALGNRDLSVLTDNLLTEISLTYVRTWNPWYRDFVRSTLYEYWGIFNGSGLAASILATSAASLSMYTSGQYENLFDTVHAIRLENLNRYQAVRSNLYFHMISLVPSRYWAAAVSALLLLGWAAGVRLTCYVFCTAAVLNLLVYYMLISLIAENVTRYAVAHELVLPLLTSLLLCNIRPPRASLHLRSS
jgi:hypothetical protein